MVMRQSENERCSSEEQDAITRPITALWAVMRTRSAAVATPTVSKTGNAHTPSLPMRHVQVAHTNAAAINFLDRELDLLEKSHIPKKHLSFVDMESSNKMPSQTSLFQVYLRLRPPIQPAIPKQKTEPWLIVEPPSSPTEDTNKPSSSTHITLQPPNESRKRAIERFGFTKIFQEEATQLDIFGETGAADAIHNLLQTGRDGLVATLGVTGSGKVDIS